MKLQDTIVCRLDNGKFIADIVNHEIVETDRISDAYVFNDFQIRVLESRSIFNDDRTGNSYRVNWPFPTIWRLRYSPAYGTFQFTA